MTAYRAHRTALQPGSAVPSSAAFFGAMPEAKRRVEEFLRFVRPSEKPNRENVVFLFSDETQGRKWAAREGRFLYRVECEEGDIVHRADWCWLQLILKGIAENSPQVAEWAYNYWSGQPTTSPVWELLATSAKIIDEILIPGLERNRLRLEAFGQADPV